MKAFPSSQHSKVAIPWDLNLDLGPGSYFLFCLQLVETLAHQGPSVYTSLEPELRTWVVMRAGEGRECWQCLEADGVETTGEEEPGSAATGREQLLVMSSPSSFIAFRSPSIRSVRFQEAVVSVIIL